MKRTTIELIHTHTHTHTHMRIAFQILFLLLIGADAKNSTAVLYPNITVTVPDTGAAVVLETDRTLTLNRTTIDYGEVYVDHVISRPVRVSATKSTHHVTESHFIIGVTTSTTSTSGFGGSTESVVSQPSQLRSQAASRTSTRVLDSLSSSVLATLQSSQTTKSIAVGTGGDPRSSPTIHTSDSVAVSNKLDDAGHARSTQVPTASVNSEHATQTSFFSFNSEYVSDAKISVMTRLDQSRESIASSSVAQSDQPTALIPSPEASSISLGTAPHSRSTTRKSSAEASVYTPVSQLLTTTASTSTKVLFSASKTGSLSSVQGSIVTSISSRSENPLVTNSLSSSKLSQSISTTFTAPKTLASDALVTFVNVTTTIDVNSNQTSVSGQESVSSEVTGTATFTPLSTTKSFTTSQGSESGTLSSASVSLTNGNPTTNVSTLVISMTTAVSNRTTVISKTTLSTISVVATSNVVTSTHASSLSTYSASSSLVETTTSLESAISSSPTGSSTGSPSSSVITTSVQTTIVTATPTSTLIDLFQPIETSEPPSVFGRHSNPMELASGVNNYDSPYETNKFYTNLIVGDQSSASFVYPYSLWKYTANGVNGFAVSHTTKDQYSFGSYDSEGNSRYLVNPLGIASLIFSADSFDSTFDLYVGNMKASSCDVTINDGSANNVLQVPLVQGMGFATGIYYGSLKPVIKTSAAFLSLEQQTSDVIPEGVLKYRVKLNSGASWLIYVTLPDAHIDDDFSLSYSDASSIVGSHAVDGLILQFAVAPNDKADDIYYDNAAGMYATTYELTGSSDGATAEYAFEYKTQGKSASGKTILFAFPHHLKALSGKSQAALTGIELQSTTKGTMQGLLANEISFTETLNSQIGWLPWSSQLGSRALTYDAAQLQLLSETANAEINIDVWESVKGLNTYYLGKVLDKYSYILLTIADILQDKAASRAALDNLKDAFAQLFLNQQVFPLYYDSKFKGIVSSGDWASTATGYDFGNTYYNDHHFHYGYIIHAAAVVAHVDSQLGGSWAYDNKAYVNALIRDVANPASNDPFFPESRMFDWFAGHSWAAGLFANPNGKNQESSSEDYNFAYAMKLWGAAIHDRSMERRADLMIAIMKRSMNDYYYYSDDNSVEPAEILGNRVAGILFDNIIDYTTYFGTETQYKNGIHMIPVTPVSSEIRGPEFVKQEWETKLAAVADELTDSWKGLLKLNQALYDPAASYAFFSAADFSSGCLDNGMSRTWALAFSGGLANSVKGV